MTEDALVAGYNAPTEAIRQGVRRFDVGNVEFRPCACGVWMGLDLNEEIDRAMRRHQQTPGHRAWRARNGL